MEGARFLFNDVSLMVSQPGALKNLHLLKGYRCEEVLNFGNTFPPTKTDVGHFEIKVFIAPLQLDE